MFIVCIIHAKANSLQVKMYLANNILILKEEDFIQSDVPFPKRSSMDVRMLPLLIMHSPTWFHCTSSECLMLLSIWQRKGHFINGLRGHLLDTEVPCVVRFGQQRTRRRDNKQKNVGVIIKLVAVQRTVGNTRQAAPKKKKKRLNISFSIAAKAVFFSVLTHQNQFIKKDSFTELFSA